MLPAPVAARAEVCERSTARGTCPPGILTQEISAETEAGKQNSFRQQYPVSHPEWDVCPVLAGGEASSYWLCGEIFIGGHTSSLLFMYAHFQSSSLQEISGLSNCCSWLPRPKLLANHCLLCKATPVPQETLMCPALLGPPGPAATVPHWIAATAP